MFTGGGQIARKFIGQIIYRQQHHYANGKTLKKNCKWTGYFLARIVSGLTRHIRNKIDEN